jgi:hypothetical protein
MKYLIPFGLVIIFIVLGFNYYQKPQKVQNTSKCSIINNEMKFQKQFFPFDFKDYDTKELLTYFKGPVKVDSTEVNNEGTNFKTYKFHDRNSSVNFFVKPKDKSEKYFYLEDSEIESNLIQFKNGVKIGMSKNEFCRIANFGNPVCDTLLIQEGDMVTSFYFIFMKTKLKKIQIKVSD